MSTIKATWKKGQVLLDTPANWPEGRRLVVSEDRMADTDFMTEDEQSGDPQAIERWIAELEALEPLSMSPEEEADLAAWRKKVKEYSIEAVRRQMQENVP
jgi:hypothetical protein